MDEDQEQFLRDEFFSLALMATTQMVQIYDREATEASKQGFRDALRARLDELSVAYAEDVNEQTHIENIEQLANDLSEHHRDALDGGRFRIGRAQKALNLYLKYLWCVGLINEPPHCPFDANIIGQLDTYNGPVWTALDDLVDYQALVAAAEVEANGVSLAVWELDEYNNID